MSTFNSIIHNCLTCKKEFWVQPARIKNGRGKYCSKKCMDESPIFAEQISNAQKGKKEIHPVWNKGIKYLAITGNKHPMWKGGIWHDSDGYIWLLRKEHPRANKYGYVLRSHIVAEKSLNRLIQSGEIIHHINGIRNEDNPENLYLFPNWSEHRKYHLLKVGSKLQSNLC